MTKRNRVIFGVASALLLVGSYFGLIKPENVRLRETKVQAEQAELRVVELTRQLSHLRDLERRAPELEQQALRLDEALPVETHLARFILQVHDASSQAKLEWLSVSPAPPVASGAAPGLMESTITMTGSGPYSAIQDFLARLEALQRAVKIGSVNLEGAATASTDPDAALNMSIDMKMFVAPTAPPLSMEPGPGQGPAPAPSPASGTANAGGPPPGTG